MFPRSLLNDYLDSHKLPHDMSFEIVTSLLAECHNTTFTLLEALLLNEPLSLDLRDLPEIESYLDRSSLRTLVRQHIDSQYPHLRKLSRDELLQLVLSEDDPSLTLFDLPSEIQISFAEAGPPLISVGDLVSLRAAAHYFPVLLEVLNGATDEPDTDKLATLARDETQPLIQTMDCLDAYLRLRFLRLPSQAEESSSE